MMRHRGGPPWNKGEWGPGRHVGFRIFGFLFFLLFIAAVIGGLFAWLLSPNRGGLLLAGLLILLVIAFTVRRAFARTWAPISELIDATTRLGDGDTSVRVKKAGRGPWAMVSQSFNRMAQRLESEDERRRRLLADLGHELRTPLTVIRGEIEAVIDGVHEPESLANVVDEVEIMERLLDDLRTLALAEAGGLELRLETTDLGALARDVLASFAAPLSRQNVEATLATVAEPVEVEVDPHRIHQVMSNLVSNSLAQMSDGGRLHVTVSQTEITVSDTGPGIPEDDLARVFDRFERAADSTGSGLGLSIARDLVEAHGGAIAASNRSGGGALFTITLPDQPPGP